jgi:outer membrane protein OmpA-like peptidoglycan-associated protein
VVPAGARPDAARRGCPLLDSDGDGVADRADECPTAPAGARPDPRRAGCPDGDRDADTVWDSIDACPDQPGAPSRDAARNGCPGLVRVSRESIQILQPVFFATARDIILESSYPVLAAVADAMQASGIAHIRVEGHTDSSGDDATNLELSRRRAESVRRWLIEHGIDESSVTAAGMGETVPFESNDTELGRAANRRVEFHIEQGASR